MTRPMIILLMTALLIAGVLSWFASSRPDGLERVAIDRGFEHEAEDPALEVMPDYEVPGVRGPLSTTLAGIIGAAAVFGLILFFGRLRTLKRNRGEDRHASPPH